MSSQNSVGNIFWGLPICMTASLIMPVYKSSICPPKWYQSAFSDWCSLLLITCIQICMSKTYLELVCLW